MCRSNYVNFCTIDLSAFQEITDTGLLALGSCGLLQSIDISCCFQVTYAGVRALGARCGLLQRINITNCRQMTDAGISALGAGCNQLRSIDDSFCDHWTDAGITVVCWIWPSVENQSHRLL